MKRKLYVVVLVLLVTQMGYSQDYAFKVLANKGGNEYKTGDTWQPLKTGASLSLNDEIRLVANGYLGLVHAKGKPMELKAAGNYKVSDLSAKVGESPTVLQKYTDFILSSNSAEAKKNKLNATGAVHRGDPSASALQLLLPENQYSGIFNNKVIISWDGSSAQIQGPYVLTFRNMFEDVIQTIETPETSYELDLSSPKFVSQNAVLVEVQSKDGKEVSKQRLIKKLSSLEQQNIKKSYDLISNDVNEATALNKFILAGFYEENKLFIDAITAYKEAIQLAPEVPEYKEAFDEFLLRQGITK